jgi:thymidine phosphorylase
MNARELGMAVVALGGGRAHADDAIDPAVGLTDVVAVGGRVRAGDPLCIVHAATDADADAAIAAIRRAIWIGETALHDRPVLMERIVQ